MSNMGRVQIFRIELRDHASGASLTLAGGRELEGYHYLDFVGDFLLQLFPEQVASLGRAVFLLSWRRQRTTPKVGAVWRRNLGDGVNAGFRLELGLTEEGKVYLEAGSTKICCDEGQGDLLIAVLERFAEDASATGQAQEALATPVQLDLMPGLRNMPPRWMRD
jgi:hypothetical protein